MYITSTTYQRDFFFGVQAVQGLGSGFLINAEGQILTNYHVISGSSDVEVTMPPDQSRYKAKVLMRDQAHDLALIQIDPKKKLTAFLKLGDSDSSAGGAEGAGDRQSVRSGGNADHGYRQFAAPEDPKRGTRQ